MAALKLSALFLKVSHTHTHTHTLKVTQLSEGYTRSHQIPPLTSLPESVAFVLAMESVIASKDEKKALHRRAVDTHNQYAKMASIGIPTHAHIRTHIHTYQTHTYFVRKIHIYADTNTRTQAHTHTHTHTHKHIHTFRSCTDQVREWTGICLLCMWWPWAQRRRLSS